MNNSRRAILVVGFLMFAGSSLARNTGIGLVLTYQARQWTRITWLAFDGIPIIGARGGGMHVSDRSRAHEALAWPSATGALPDEVHAVWRYKVIDPVDEAAQHVLHEKELVWREAEAKVSLSKAMDEEVRSFIQKGTHRARLVLTFDRDSLSVQWNAERKR